jgi:hypothetical protein
MRIAMMMLMAGVVGCGGNAAVKEPDKFAPMPDASTMAGSDGKLKPLGAQSGKKMSAPLTPGR